jgi:PAS domain S-box-containing protein
MALEKQQYNAFTDADERIAELETQLAAERDKRQWAEMNLAQLQQFQQWMLNALPDSCWFKDMTGRYRMVNDAFCAFHQLLPGLILGASVEEVFDVDLADRMRIGDEAAIACGRLYRSESHVIMDSDTGRERWVETMKQAIYDNTGQMLGIVGMNHDITAQRSAELDRLNMERSLHEAQRQESIGLLASGIAHDFNNVLTSILGNAQLAQLDIANDPSTQESLRQIVASTQYAARLSSQLLSYAGKGHIHIQTTNLNMLVHDIAEMIYVSLPRSVKLEHQLVETLPMIAGDVTQLQQVILNLLTNAAEAMGPDGGSIALHTAVDTLDDEALHQIAPNSDLPRGRYVRLEVHDTGAGMDQETMARIFEPFFSTKRTGRGLGLAAVQGIIRRHQGVLRVSSIVGQGTSFRIWLPVNEASEI